MSRQEVYDVWREKSRQVDIAESFADQVMKHVYQYQQNRSKLFFNFGWLMDLILEHPLGKTAFVVIGAITGLIRIAFVVCVFLGT